MTEQPKPELGCDQDEPRFEAVVERVAKAEPKSRSSDEAGI